MRVVIDNKIMKDLWTIKNETRILSDRAQMLWRTIKEAEAQIDNDLEEQAKERGETK